MRVISKESIDRENRMDTLDLRHDLDSSRGRARNYLIYIRRVNSPEERSSIKGGSTTRKGKKRNSLKRRKRGFRYTCKFCVAGRIGIAKTLIHEEIIFSFFFIYHNSNYFSQVILKKL